MKPLSEPWVPWFSPSATSACAWGNSSRSATTSKNSRAASLSRSPTCWEQNASPPTARQAVTCKKPPSPSTVLTRQKGLFMAYCRDHAERRCQRGLWKSCATRRQKHEADGQQGQRYPEDVAVLGAVHDLGDAGSKPGGKQQQSDGPEKRQRLEAAEEREDRPEHAKAVAIRVQLTDAAVDPLAIRHLYLDDAQAMEERLHGKLGFDFEARRAQWNTIRDVAAKRSVAAHDVGQAGARHPVDQKADELVTEQMKRAEGTTGKRLQPRADAHVASPLSTGRRSACTCSAG